MSKNKNEKSHISSPENRNMFWKVMFGLWDCASARDISAALHLFPSYPMMYALQSLLADSRLTFGYGPQESRQITASTE
jgi:hypothetical protein